MSSAAPGSGTAAADDPAPETPPPAAPSAGEKPPPTGKRPDKRISALRRFALSITALTVVGQLFLGFEQPWSAPVTAVLTGYVVELLLESVEAWSRHRRPGYAGGVVALVDFLLPAHITGLACALLLYGDSRVLPMVFAVTVSVASKYVFRVRINGRTRHILNPSNLGISLTLLAFPSVGMFPPWMFTENVGGVLDWIVPVAILAAGTMLNATLTGKIPLILGWVGGFVLQAVLRALLQPHTALVGELVPIAGTAFVLFTNYMITDPGTTPAGRRGQVLFGLSTAAMYGVLIASHIVFPIFWALALVGLCRLVWYTGRNHLPLLAQAGRRRSTPVPA
jgi:hypothetical protein